MYPQRGASAACPHMKAMTLLKSVVYSFYSSYPGMLNSVVNRMELVSKPYMCTAYSLSS